MGPYLANPKRQRYQQQQTLLLLRLLWFMRRLLLLVGRATGCIPVPAAAAVCRQQLPQLLRVQLWCATSRVTGHMHMQA